MDTTAPPLYFAYGSNMLQVRLRARVPGARLHGTALLNHHALRWHKRGRDGSGKCDIVPCDDDAAVVHGVLWAIPPDEQAALDAAEGLGRGYDILPVTVVCKSRPVPAFAYRATELEPDLQPFDWYHALVLAGADEQGLPAHYVNALRQVQTQADPDRARHHLHMALIEEAAGAGTGSAVLLAHLQAREVELHHPGAACSADRLQALLHPAFHEVGRSGRRYDRATVAAFLLAPPDTHDVASVQSGDFAVQPLGEHDALLTYRSWQLRPDGVRDRATHRMSIWSRTDRGWQLRYHQGTPATDLD
jgi:gamma-glutamylcyclotransferase